MIKIRAIAAATAAATAALVLLSAVPVADAAGGHAALKVPSPTVLSSASTALTSSASAAKKMKPASVNKVKRASVEVKPAAAVAKKAKMGKTPAKVQPTAKSAAKPAENLSEPGPVIKAKAVLLAEASTGKVLYAKNDHEKLPPASITKVMTEILTLEAIESGKLKWDEMLTCSAHASSMGGSDISLAPNERMSVRDLFKALAISSANDAAVVFAEKIGGSEQGFVRLMNKKAQELGMHDTHFVNANGLDADGHLTSAYDIMLMSRELLKHKDIFKFCLVWMDYLRVNTPNKRMLVNTNKLIRSYNGINGLKTGMTGKAGFCITATAKRDGMQLIAVTLGSDNSKDRNATATSLLDYGFGGWSLVQPTPLQTKFTVNVQGGADYTVNAALDKMPSLLVTKGEESNVTQKLDVVTDVAAPVEKGQVVGRIMLFENGKSVGTAEIKTVCAVPKMTVSIAFAKLFSYLAG